MSQAGPAAANVLEARDLTVTFFKNGRSGRALDNISIEIPRGKVVGLVGESGCGKTVLGSTIIGLLPDRGVEITSGSVLFNERNGAGSCDLLDFNYHKMKKYRGSRISMIFQEPMSALNPIYTVGSQVDEAIANCEPGLGRAGVMKRTLEMFDKVGMPDPGYVYGLYPHQLSGGMRQRVVIAIATANHPDLIIADEPTTALDITISEQILFLLMKIRRDYNSSIILITHDLGVVSNTCDEVYVMYRGSILEHGTSSEIFGSPRNPYTVGLMKSLPEFSERGGRLNMIAGNVPSIFSAASGCKFRDRCPRATEACGAEPPLARYSPTHYGRCHNPHV